MDDWQHANKSCFKKPCRNATHWKLYDTNGKEITSPMERIRVMRQIWHGLAS